MTDARITTRIAWLAIIPLCAVAALVAVAWLALAAMYDPKGRRAWELAEGFDRLGNAAIGGDSEMTISAHADLERERGKRWACWLCWLLDHVDPEHCEKSFAAWFSR